MTNRTPRTVAIGAAGGLATALAVVAAPVANAAPPAPGDPLAVAFAVARDGTELANATGTLNRSARVPGTSWSVDPASKKVVVSVDRTVTGAKLAKVRAAAQRAGNRARIERVPGRFTTKITGGEAIHGGGGGRCSLGFNVKRGDESFFLTAGHCTEAIDTWFEDAGGSQPLGSNAGSSFPGDDYGIVKYDAAAEDTTGTVHLYPGEQDITQAGDATVGQAVRRSGSTTQVHEGTVTAVNATVTYPEGTVTGLIRTNVCAEPGDSGGSLFAGDTALGLTSGGSGNCTTGGITFFQPVTEALQAFDVEIY